MQILKVILIILEVILLFNLLIVVHELGHFLAAKWRGLVVEKFGIWFGKPLWKKTIGGVEYSLGTIPAGGFVALPQMAPMEAIEGKSDSDKQTLPPVSPLDKIIVAFAGPLFSFGLAFIFAVIVWVVGKPVAQGEATTTIGYVVEGGPAAEAGLMPGDKILTVDGGAVEQFSGMDDSVTWQVIRSEGETIPFVVERAGQQLEIAIPAKTSEESGWWKRKTLRQVQIYPETTPVVGKILPGSTAADAGLRKYDKILKANGQPVYHFLSLAEIRAAAGNEAIEIVVERKGEQQTLSLLAPGLVVDSIMFGSPAAKAGLQSGDKILAVDGTAVHSRSDVSEVVKANLGREIPIKVERANSGAEESVSLKPLIAESSDGTRKPLIGIEWRQEIEWEQWGVSGVVNPNPLTQIEDSLKTITKTLGAVFSSKSDVSLQHLSGPIGIFSIYYRMFESDKGWQLALWFSVVLNVNLAVLNLLPLPVLDGGHITIALIEWIRRRPVNIRILEVVQTGCALLLIGFMLYVTFYDVSDHLGGPGDIKFVEPDASEVQAAGDD